MDKEFFISSEEIKTQKKQNLTQTKIKNFG